MFVIILSTRGVQLSEGRDKSEMGDFASLGLSDWLIKQCKQLGINKPSPVQENCMPPILEGKTGYGISLGHKYTFTKLATYSTMCHG